MAGGITIRLRNNALQGSLLKLRDESRKLPSLLVNKACFSIAHRAFETMPKVTAAKMDSELNASIGRLNTILVGSRSARMAMLAGNPRISKSKKDVAYFFGGVGQRSKGGGTYRGAGGYFAEGAQYGYKGVGYRKGKQGSLTPHGPNAHSDVPLAALIVNAQVNPDSNFNQITGHYFQRMASPFKGKSRAAGAQAMLDAMRRMLSARHQSGGFFKLCADVVRKVFGPAVSNRQGLAEAVMTGLDAVAGSGSVSKAIGKLAGGKVATGATDVAHASFWVTGTNPDTDGSKGGAALFAVAQPVWQKAVDDEAANNFRTAAERAYIRAALKAGIPVV